MVDFIEETPVTVVTITPRLPRPRDISPWADQTPVAILEREYALSDIIYTTSSATTLFIAPTVFQQTAFSKAMSSFRYLRWDYLEWRYQIMSVPQVWGAMAFTCIPMDSRRSSTLALDYGLLSHTDCQIADFSTANNGRLMVPWCSVNKWLDWASYADDPFDLIFNTLKIIGGPWIYSADSSIPKSVTINLWCSLHGVQVAGPRVPDTLPGVSEEAQMQSGAILGAAGVLYSAAQTEFTKYMATSGVNHLRNAAQAGFHQVDEVLGDWFDFDNPTTPPDQGGESGGMSVVPDIYGNLNISQPKALIGVGSQILPRKPPPHKWLDFIMLPSFYSYSELTGNVVFSGWPFTKDDVDVTAVTTPRCLRLDFASQFFRMWRGSFEYTFMFVSSSLIVQKVGVSISYTPFAGRPGDVVTEVIEVRGTTIHKILVPFLYTNPYQFAQDEDSVEERPYIQITPYSVAKAAGDTTPSLLMLVWQNAASDFKFYSPKCPQYQSELPGPVEMQTSIRSFSKIQPSRQFEVVENDVPFWPDQTITMEQLAQRWSCRTVPDPDAMRTLSTLPPFHWNTADCIKSIFYYNRGQYKVKMTFIGDDAYDAASAMMAKLDPRSRYTNNPVPIDWRRINDGVQIISYGLTQLLEYTVPFYCGAEWTSTYIFGSGVYGATPRLLEVFLYNVGDVTDSSPVPSFCATGMCPDFALSIQLPPPYSGKRWYLTDEPPAPEPEPRVQTPSNKQRLDVTTQSPSNKDSRKMERRKILSSENDLRRSRAGK